MVGSSGCTRSPKRGAFWRANESCALVDAIDPETDELLHPTLVPTQNTVIAQKFVAKRREKHVISPWFSSMTRKHAKTQVDATVSVPV